MTTAPSRSRTLARSIGQNSRARTSAAHAWNVILTAVGPPNSTWGESADSGGRRGAPAVWKERSRRPAVRPAKGGSKFRWGAARHGDIGGEGAKKRPAGEGSTVT